MSGTSGKILALVRELPFHRPMVSFGKEESLQVAYLLSKNTQVYFSVCGIYTEDMDIGVAGHRRTSTLPMCYIAVHTPLTVESS